MATRITAGAGEVSIRAPPHHRQLVANLVIRRPDVIKELDLNHRLQPARGHANGAAHDVGFRQRRIEDALAAKLHLQAGSQLEHAALALDLFFLQIFFAAAIRHIFAKHHNAIIAPHLVFQAGIDQVGHGLVAAL